MKYVGKRGGYYFYGCNTPIPLKDAMPYIEKDHIIAGGSALWLIDKSKKFKDIDVWTAGTIPIEAKQESQYAYNYRNADTWGYHPNVQYMKIAYKTPTELLDTFDLDICKVAAYNITDAGYSLCIHKFIRPLVFDPRPSLGLCGVNKNCVNPGLIVRMHKYAKKFRRQPLSLFSKEDYKLALYNAGFTDIPYEEVCLKIDEYLENNPDDGGYELLEHLQSLFHREDLVDVVSLF